MHRTAVLLLVLLLLPIVMPACRRNPPPSPSSSAGSTGPVVVPQVAPPLPDLKLPALTALPTEQAVAMLIRAHYDPAKLGLRELAFRVDLALPQVKTRAQATGSWRKDESVQVTVTSVDRKGRTEGAPRDPGVGNQIWKALQYQTEQLLEGMGAGFLSKRLEHWQKLKGTSKLEGERLILDFNEESGETLVTVGKGWVVERVENRSPRKINRWMDYRYRLEKGHNLVTLARMHVAIAEGAALPPGEVTIQKSQEGLTFHIDYRNAGGYLLPAELRKTSSRGEETLIKLRYTGVK